MAVFFGKFRQGVWFFGWVGRVTPCAPVLVCGWGSGGQGTARPTFKRAADWSNTPLRAPSGATGLECAWQVGRDREGVVEAGRAGEGTSNPSGVAGSAAGIPLPRADGGFIGFKIPARARISAYCLDYVNEKANLFSACFPACFPACQTLTVRLKFPAS
jgi:hypothetical protein